MKTINITNLKRLPTREILQSIPALILSDGRPVAILADPEGIINISDMHPTVRKQFKAMEARIRLGMPMPEPVAVAKSEE